MPPPRVSKYQPLADYLAAQHADEVTLSFTQIEAILRRPLPTSAYLRPWWLTRRSHHVASLVWRAAGWDAIAVLRRAGERWVTFRRRPASTDDNDAG